MRKHMDAITDALQQVAGWSFIIGFIVLMTSALLGVGETIAYFSITTMVVSVGTLLVWLIIDSIFNH